MGEWFTTSPVFTHLMVGHVFFNSNDSVADKNYLVIRLLFLVSTACG
jgi:hypothetical protein